jgi:MFS family permease
LKLSKDGYLLMTARAVRMLAYGFLSVVLALYLGNLGWSGTKIGIFFTSSLAGSAVTTVVITLLANRWGKRRWLIVSALLMIVSGIVLALSHNFVLLLVFALLGTLSPSGQEMGAFQSLEQASLAETLTDVTQAQPYAWYNLVGSFASAIGAFLAGVVPGYLERNGWSSLEAQRWLVWAFALTGVVLVMIFAALSNAVETKVTTKVSKGVGLGKSRGIVFKLSALFGVDALAGGLVVQSLVAYWFHQRFGIGLDILGPIFFVTNVLSALSYLAAARIAKRFGLLNTMVFTHLPSNVLLALVPLMPTWKLAAIILFLRHMLSQMDVPTRQAYTMAVVAPEERAAAAGLTNAVRPAASSLAPLISGIALQSALSGLPFILSGGLKVIYDLALYFTFRNVTLESQSKGEK